MDNPLYWGRKFLFVSLREWVPRRNHVDLGVGAELFHQTIDQPRFNQRLVTLDIYDNSELLRVPNYFGYAIGSAFVPRRGHGNVGAPIERRLGDPHVVCRDND